MIVAPDAVARETQASAPRSGTETSITPPKRGTQRSDRDHPITVETNQEVSPNNGDLTTFDAAAAHEADPTEVSRAYVVHDRIAERVVVASVGNSNRVAITYTLPLIVEVLATP